MKTIFKLIISTLIFSCSTPVFSAPKTEYWELGHDTKKVVYLVPDLGTRLVFPFMLTNESLSPKLAVTITNPAYSVTPDITGNIDASIVQNTLTLMVDREKVLTTVDERGNINPFLGYLYLSVNGLNLTLELRTTLDVSKMFANIEMGISNEQRDYLIAETVKRRTESLELDYQKKAQGLDVRASEQALSMVGEMAWITPKTTRIREDFPLRTANNHRLEIKIDDFKSFDSFTTLRFAIENQETTAIHIAEINLYRDLEARRPITIHHQCDQKIERYSALNCVISTKDDVANVDDLILRIDTNKGAGEIKW